MSANSTIVRLPMSDDLSWETTMMVITVNIVVLVGAVSIVGITSNVISILVFCKQGFSGTTNITYTGLALSDMLTLVAALFLSVFWNPMFLKSGLPLVFVDIQAALATLPFGCFSRITGWLTTFITLERCLCVVWPLKVKIILTKIVTVTLVVFVYLIMFLTMVPVYLTLLLGWTFDPRTNMTLLGAIISTENKLLSNISYSLHAAIQLFAFFVVVVCTSGLTFRLRQKTQWRNQLTNAQNATKSAARREDRAIKMATLIAAIYIVCYTPTVVFLVVTVIHPGFNAKGSYINAFITFWSFVTLCGVLNASVNLFVYHHMSSKFRQTCNQMFNGLFACMKIPDTNISTENQ